MRIIVLRWRNIPLNFFKTYIFFCFSVSIILFNICMYVRIKIVHSYCVIEFYLSIIPIYYCYCFPLTFFLFFFFFFFLFLNFKLNRFLNILAGNTNTSFLPNPPVWDIFFFLFIYSYLLFLSLSYTHTQFALFVLDNQRK